MKASLRVFVATAWLGLAGLVPAASAQSDLAPAANPGDNCGPMCRFLQNLTGTAPAPAQTTQAQAEEQPEGVRKRRIRRSESRKAKAAAAVAETRETAQPRHPTKRAAEVAQPKRQASKPRTAQSPASDVEQTSSVPAKPAEVSFVAGADEAHRGLADDLARAVAPDVSMRIIPGRGLALRDVLSLPGADLTITSSLTLARGSAYGDKVVYLSKLFTEELHALAGPGVARLEDLAGKPVYLGPIDSDSAGAAETLLRSRGISVNPVGGSFASAVSALRAGRVAAAFILAPKPFAPLKELAAADGVHFLPLPYRTSDDGFYPAALTGSDYPGLVGEGERIETVALDAVLVAPRWREDTPRQRELAGFTTRFFDRLGNLAADGRHPKWSETNPAASVVGFLRLKPAQQWVAARLKARGFDSVTARVNSITTGEAR